MTNRLEQLNRIGVALSKETDINRLLESISALGWDTRAFEGSSAGRYFGRDSVGHTGFTGTSIWMDLEKDVIAILLTNRVHPKRDNDKIKQFRSVFHDAVMEELGLVH